jgi:CRISPR/Cas system Type II protein with McrA/HNH and RuvC-like nuclease domain
MDLVLVLNSDYSPLNVTSLRRGFILVDKGKAEIVEKGDEDIITTIGNYIRPTIIRLLNYVRFRPTMLRVNRKRIFKRDNNTCCYCGSQKNLTVDHVLPKSRGGKNTWENMITSCFRCNGIKDDRTPEEAGMKMLYKPYQPDLFSVVFSEDVEKTWKSYENKLSNMFF